MARPKKEVTREKTLQIRITEEDFSKIEALAKKANMKTSTFVRGNLLSWLAR